MLFRALFVREFLRERNSLAVKLASSNISLFHSRKSATIPPVQGSPPEEGGWMENPEHPCEHLGTATQAMAAELIPGGAKLRKNVRWVPRAELG